MPRSTRLPAPFGSIRVRLTLWYVVILGLVMLIFSGVVYTAQEQSLQAHLRDSLRTTSQQLAATYDPTDRQLHFTVASAKQLGRTGPDATPDTLAGTPVFQSAEDKKKEAARLQAQAQTTVPAISLSPTTTVALFDIQQGEFSQQFGPALDDATMQVLRKQIIAGVQARDGFVSPPSGTATAGAPTAKYLFYATPVVVKDTAFAVLIVGQPDDTQAQLRQLALTLLLAAPATLLIAAVGGYWLASRALRPVRAITRTAREIGASDLSRRLRLRGHDELGQLAATFDGMLDRLEAAFARQRQFTSDASHELRTPLTIVNLEVEHALNSPRTTAEYLQALTTIQVENERMTRLVNDLLTLARADVGRAVLKREPLDLSDLALEVVERVAPLAHQHHLALITGALPELPVAGDRLYLTQMLTNIVENAIKYTAGSGSQVSIEAGSRPSQNGSLGWVRVTDNGPGIAAAHLAHLFDRFYRVDQARSQDHDAAGADVPVGSGLGLAIVQWVAQTHGGEVVVLSTPDQGATFEVRLPLCWPGRANTVHVTMTTPPAPLAAAMPDSRPAD
ncbi:MAG: sensor histidine kinase [Thermomicrobiales bacterium]